MKTHNSLKGLRGWYSNTIHYFCTSIARPYGCGNRALRDVSISWGVCLLIKIAFKYLGLGATVLGSTIVGNNNSNSTDPNEVSRARVGKILSIGSGVVAFLSQVVQDVQTVRLGERVDALKTNQGTSRSDDIGSDMSLPDIKDSFDDYAGRYITDGRNFSLFKVIQVNDDAADGPTVLIQFRHGGETVEIWIKASSSKLVWD